MRLFDYEAINKLSLPKKLQLRLFLTETGVSFNLPEGTHVRSLLRPPLAQSCAADKTLFHLFTAHIAPFFGARNALTIFE